MLKPSLKSSLFSDAETALFPACCLLLGMFFYFLTFPSGVFDKKQADATKELRPPGRCVSLYLFVRFKFVWGEKLPANKGQA